MKYASGSTLPPCLTVWARLAVIPALIWSLALPLSAQPPRETAAPDHVPNRLVVLLVQGDEAPAPERVVAARASNAPIPAGLGVGGPVAVEHALRLRTSGAAREAIESRPDGPRARLERYLIFVYPPDAPLDTIQKALERNPHVERVEKDILFDMAVSPNDPWYDYNTNAPSLHQWGSVALSLPAAWDRARGHGYVGLIDLGSDVDHPDLQAIDASGTYLGGNLRTHMSWDYRNPSTCDDEDPNCIDEKEEGGIDCSAQEDPDENCAGHGTHVSGIVGANSNNGTGVAGACWNCSVLMTRGVSNTQAGNGLVWHAEHGAQAISMSFGNAAGDCDPVASGYSFFCDALDTVEEMDVLLTASPGNDKTDIEFPASDPRVMSIGGIEPSGVFWDRADEGEGCPCDWSNKPMWLVNACNAGPSTLECGSNYTVTTGSAPQDLVAPAKEVLSTFYPGEVWNKTLGCWDDPNHAGSGYDVCTGTSMSSPYVAAVSGILRSINPLLSKAEIRESLTSNASLGHLSSPHAKLGFGVPDTEASVEDVLGPVSGQVLDNRLTPLFQLYSSIAGDYAYTTVPQYAAGLTLADEEYVSPLSAPLVGGYGPYFPGGATCQVGPCIYYARASTYVFTTEVSPNGHPLVPLYRLSFDGSYGGNPDDRDHSYTTEAAGIEAFAAVGYRLDGVEGYIYERCTPEPSCIPAGAVRLYRYYNSSRDDWAIFPESELSSWTSQGYSAQSGTNPWIGYVYENVDTDGDHVIDGFENLIGTNPSASDSDCDGSSDGAEILEYPYTDPKVGSC